MGLTVRVSVPGWGGTVRSRGAGMGANGSFGIMVVEILLFSPIMAGERPPVRNQCFQYRPMHSQRAAPGHGRARPRAAALAGAQPGGGRRGGLPGTARGNSS